ncbi:MAG TPA: hypothetical protein VK250_07180 [Nitrososphaeraceae archaeon]|nr:hypothetical protein [Nitrososphaeraceae archaeon]
MKALAISMALGVILMNIFSLGNVYALKDKDDRYLIITVDNVKSRDIELTAYIYDKDKDKKIQGSPDPIEETGAQVKHTFKFDNDDLKTDVGPGTQFIVCMEFKSGAGEVSCWTDTFKSVSQPNRVTLDADYIRD